MDQFGNYNQIYHYATNNRVYINRNFNRIGTGVPTSSNSNVMYFNPNFSYMGNLQQNIIQQSKQAVRPKIHFNPSFVRSSTQGPSIVNKSETNTVQSISQSLNTYKQLTSTGPPQAFNKHQTNTQMATVSKSRYCLVRQKENKRLEAPSTNKIQQTVKVSKYKLISLNAAKENLATSKSTVRKISETTSNQHNFLKSKSKYRITSKPISNNVQNTRFKFVKHNSTTLLNSSETKQCTIRRISITLNKSTIKTNAHKKTVKGAMKKNNIPCPLFKKYGKCLRMCRGSCDYLHDKKHVSICRKFLKGICHDKQCLLSHDLTDKKMPTCYFYLQGNCTKDSCPYLHVKLNERIKICQDFMKGYCEMGEKCIYRHVDISPGTALKVVRKLIHTDRKTINRKKTVNKKATTSVKFLNENQSERELAKDQRYFRDVANNLTSGDQCDLIKPTRCKLGTLPSFIQL